MNRFIVLYLHQDAYRHIACQTQLEANDYLKQVFIREGGTPMGIYDAKTELFKWEPVRQLQYDQLCLEEQSRLGHHIIAIAQLFLTQVTSLAAIQLQP
ncbi:hypothetical protein GO755_39635 [Spirosoma sp. HMF4905]|uniref:Uncharacterized protein n=1 Tax=Spirosoma arboris TaxID=2682092 RepID=A0A7K1SR15_9BACT|nr:hypothetical protein [Spirosoma arboris]MVM36190.1 hypothetical protein [Spirosoma arboris]